MAKVHRARSLGPAGITLGIGLGGMLDGIVLHEILQLHSMLSGRLPRTDMANLEINMFADGLFHAATWTVTIVGLILLWRALNPVREVAFSGVTFLGYLLAGWGWFNLIEGLVDHHLLGLHHVVQAAGLSLWDWLYLASGVVLIMLGHLLSRPRRQIK